MELSASGPLAYDVVDVFTSEPFAGNPLAVVRGTAGLTDSQLQAIAGEFNLSETAFPWPAEAGGDYRLRIFTPAVELPFAGHPSLGAAWVLRSHGLLAGDRFVQECGAGLLPLEFSGDSVTLTGGTPEVSAPLPASEVAAAVGLSADDVVAPPHVAGAGLGFTYLLVAPGAVDRAQPDPVALAGYGAGGISVSSWHGGQAYTRVFAGGVGVDEDPATGSAALGFGVYAAAVGLIPDGSSTLTINQGVAMGRPSLLTVVVEARDGAAVEVRVRGDVVPVASGSISVPSA